MLRQFKIHNLNLRDDPIVFAENAWIEDNVAVSDKTRATFGSGYKLRETLAYAGLHRLKPQFIRLLQSNTIISTDYGDSEVEGNPLDVPRGSDVAIALSIFSSNQFLTGIDIITKKDGRGSYGTHMTHFLGNNEPIILSKMDENQLSRIYNFVRDANLQKRDEFSRLLWLFISIIIDKYPTGFNILNYHFSSPIGVSSETIIYGTMFFEHVFTNTGWVNDIEDGIKKYWNIYFPTMPITWEDVKIIHKYRTTLVHDNPVKAQKQIKDWQQKNKISNDDLLRTLEKMVIKNVKLIMRTIALNYEQYLEYRKSLPAG